MNEKNIRQENRHKQLRVVPRAEFLRYRRQSYFRKITSAPKVGKTIYLFCFVRYNVFVVMLS